MKKPIRSSLAFSKSIYAWKPLKRRNEAKTCRRGRVAVVPVPNSPCVPHDSIHHNNNDDNDDEDNDDGDGDGAVEGCLYVVDDVVDDGGDGAVERGNTAHFYIPPQIKVCPSFIE